MAEAASSAAEAAPTKTERASTAVSVSHVRFRWPKAAADTVDIQALDIAHGERLFIEGPSGSGKSTLLSLLGGVSVPREGKIELLGTDLAKLGAGARDRFRADHVGFVFQLFNLVPYLSMHDNVVLPCRFSSRRRERVECSGGQLEESRRLLSALELDTHALRQRTVTELSIGQQQRVAVARALMGEPEVLIADEPTSALDEGTRARFVVLLLAECERSGTSVIFVSHDPRLSESFHRRVSLADINRVPGLG